MEEYTLQDFENVLCLKNQLISVGIVPLMDVYEDYDNYITFIDSVAVLTNIDSAFLLLDDSFAEKITSVMGIHRFRTKDKEVLAVINSIIDYLNGLKTQSKALNNVLKNNYLAYHEEARKATITSQEQFLYSLSYDAVVLAALKEGNMDLITEDDMFLASINYLMATVPELFQDKEVRERANKKIKELSEKGWPFNRRVRKYSKETMDAFQKIKTKEE